MSTTVENEAEDAQDEAAPQRKSWSMPSEVDFYAKMLSSISGKGHEVYAISRILHLLDDPEIELVTQQPIRLLNGKLALLDLYLPQFGICIEVDERHHVTPDNVEYDKAREHAIVQTTDVDIIRVGEGETTTLDTLKEQVDELIELIRARKNEELTVGTFTPFFYGNRYDPMYWRSVGKITTLDDAQMARTHYVCALFGKNYLGWQPAVMPLGDDLRLWMPVLTQGTRSRKDWKNTLSPDGLTLREEQQKDGNPWYDRDMRSVVFAKFKDPVTLADYYRFLGVFRVEDISEIDGKKVVTYARVADEIDLTEYPDPPARE